MVDQDPPHRFAREAHEVRAAAEEARARAAQLEEGLVDQRGRLQRVRGSLARHVGGRHAVQGRVHAGEQLVAHGGVAGLETREQLLDLPLVDHLGSALLPGHRMPQGAAAVEFGTSGGLYANHGGAERGPSVGSARNPGFARRARAYCSLGASVAPCTRSYRTNGGPGRVMRQGKT